MVQCVSACNATGVNVGAVASLAAVVGGQLAMVSGATRTNAARLAFKPVSMYAKDLIQVVAQAGTAYLGSKSATYLISQLSDYIPSVTVQSSWPALIACDVNTPVGQQAIAVKQYPILPPSPLVRNCAEQAFFEKYADLRVETLCGAITSGIRNYLIQSQASYNVRGLDSVCEDISKRQALAWFTNYRAVAMIDCAEVRFNNVRVDTATKESIWVLDETYSTSGARMKNVTGGFDTLDELILASQQTQCYFTNMPFFFYRKYRSYGNALATASAISTPIQVVISFLPIDQLIQVSKPNLSVRNFSTNATPRNEDVQIQVVVELSHVEVALRDLLALAPYTIVYLYTQTLIYTNNTQQITLDMKNAVKAMWVFVRTEAASANNEWFDFAGLAGTQPVVAVTLNFNSTARINTLSTTGSVGTEQTNSWQNTRPIAEAYIWFFAFAFELQDYKYVGSASFDAYQTITLRVALQDGLELFPLQLFVVYQAYNLIRFVDSTSSAVYAIA